MTRCSGLKYKDGKASGPAFWRATVNLAKAGDTFWMCGWGKGVVWVNGHCLGRYWNIGPTQTAYVPGRWLKAEKIKSSSGICRPENTGHRRSGKTDPRSTPPRTGFRCRRRPDVDAASDRGKPAHTGVSRRAGQQEVKFATPANGRYFCLESVTPTTAKPSPRSPNWICSDEWRNRSTGNGPWPMSIARNGQGGRHGGKCNRRPNREFLAQRVETENARHIHTA